MTNFDKIILVLISIRYFWGHNYYSVYNFGNNVKIMITEP